MKHSAKYSCLYTGWVRHRRFKPMAHRFSYPIFMCYLDLDEIKELLERRWFSAFEFFNIVSFRRQDYFQGKRPGKKDASAQELKQDVIDHVQTDARDNGLDAPEIERVCILTHLRYFNLQFNPVSLYYCYSEQDELLAILAEITNTPWGERHSYVMHVAQSHQRMAYRAKGRHKHCFEFQKAFHVSPFNPMNMDYRWNFSEPNHVCLVHMDNLMQPESKSDVAEHEENRVKHFDATLSLKRKPIGEFGRVLIRYPLMCVSVITGIYWQALKLWLKKAPFYDHPNTKEA